MLNPSCHYSTTRSKLVLARPTRVLNHQPSFRRNPQFRNTSLLKGSSW